MDELDSDMGSLPQKIERAQARLDAVVAHVEALRKLQPLHTRLEGARTKLPGLQDRVSVLDTELNGLNEQVPYMRRTVCVCVGGRRGEPGWALHSCGEGGGADKLHVRGTTTALMRSEWDGP